MQKQKDQDPLVNIIHLGLSNLAFPFNGNHDVIARKINIGKFRSFKEYLPSLFKQAQLDSSSTLTLKHQFDVSNLSIPLSSVCTLSCENIEQSSFYASFMETDTIIDMGRLKHSGSKFYFTIDQKFILKTIAKSQFQFLVRIAQKYLDRLSAGSFLVRIHGLFRVEVKGRKFYFIAMENSLSGLGEIDKSRVFDIKPDGLLHGRDNGDYIRYMSLFHESSILSIMDRKTSEKFVEILKKDVAFLESVNVNDYSLFLGFSSDKISIAMIDILSEFHSLRKFGYVLMPGISVYFPRFMRPKRYAERMDKTIDKIFGIS